MKTLIKGIEKMIKDMSSVSTGFVTQSNSIVMGDVTGGSKVTINGKTLTIQGNNISVINGKIFVDGKEYNGDNSEKNVYMNVSLIVEGNVKSISLDGNGKIVNNGIIENLVADGNISLDSKNQTTVMQNITADGNISVNGNLTANSVTADGNIFASGNMNVKNNKGNIKF